MISLFATHLVQACCLHILQFYGNHILELYRLVHSIQFQGSDFQNQHGKNNLPAHGSVMLKKWDGSRPCSVFIRHSFWKMKRHRQKPNLEIGPSKSLRPIFWTRNRILEIGSCERALWLVFFPTKLYSRHCVPGPSVHVPRFKNDEYISKKSDWAVTAEVIFTYHWQAVMSSHKTYLFVPHLLFLFRWQTPEHQLLMGLHQF